MNRRTARDLRWLVSAVVLAAGVGLGVHLRAKLTAPHDPGFVPPAVSHRAPDEPSRGASRHAVVSAPGQFIALDPSGRFLINSITHKPVFLTGDAAWSLITELKDADAETYLADRAARGFNYIWCAAADDYYPSHAPENAYGDRPFDGADFTGENEKYWAHVDDILRRAEAHGITVALDPGFVGLEPGEGYLVSYQKTAPAVLTAYGTFLGERYRGYPNVIWAMGGDVDPQSGVVPKLDALAEGIRSQDKVHLVVAEGQPQHAALDTYGDPAWMDLNWLYFHTTNIPSGVTANDLRKPWLPPFEGEAWYEDDQAHTTELDIREQGYWAVLSGATLGNGGFGNSPLWYFRGGPPVRAGDPSWQSQLGSPGSVAQMDLGRLFRSREHWKLVPDLQHKVMTGGYDSRTLRSAAWEHLRAVVRREPYRLGSGSAVAARTEDGQTIIAYIPDGSAETIRIAMDAITDAHGQSQAWWFNPRDGSSRPTGSFAAQGTRAFTPPDTEDWVLVIDSAAAKLGAPGQWDLQE